MAVQHACPRLRLLAAALLLAGGVAASGGDKLRVPPGTSNPDKVLYERGTAALNDKKWITAREYFRQIVDGYPQSSFRADAKLGLGDTYLGEGTSESYLQAINEFREFLTYYPTHPRADYAQYKLGLAHYAQMRGPERDQTETKEAIRELQACVDRFPNSGLRKECEAKLREAKDRLSMSDYRVGLFYYRSRWYPGAIDRFKAVLKNDPGFTNRDAVYYHLGESLLKTDKKAEALPYFERLIAEFQQSEFLDVARKRVAELKGSGSSDGA